VSLLELSDLNWAEAFRELTRRAGGIVHDEGGLMLYAGPHPFPVMVNGVFRTGDDPSAADVLARAREFFGRHERGFSINVRGHADADLLAAVEHAGLTRIMDCPGMVLDHRLADAVPPAGVILRRVTTAADATAFGEVQGAAYATYGMPTDIAPACVGRLEVLNAPHIATFLALLDGKPAAGAMTIVTHGVAASTGSARRPRRAAAGSPRCARARRATRASISAGVSPRCRPR
jgi:hypothetical protein